MKYLIPFIFLISVGSQAQPDVTIGIVGSNFVYDMSGKLSNLDIGFHYSVSQNIVSGNYYYQKYYQPISILGHWEKDSLKMYEFDSLINKTGLFKGVIKNAMLSGVWINLKTGKRLPFQLSSGTIPSQSNVGKVFIKNDGTIKFYEIADDELPQPVDLTVIDQFKQNDNSYFLFRLGSYSKPNGDGNGYCGAGYEEKIVLIKTDAKLNIVSRSSYLINSCFKNYVADDDSIGWAKGKIFSLQGDISSDDSSKHFKITYDKGNPDLGMKIEYTPGK